MHDLLASFLFGLGTSLHCVGMCGPIAAFVLDGRGTATAYHAGRAAAYTAAGAGVGAFGTVFGTRSLAAAGAWVALSLGACLALYALRWFPAVGSIRGLAALTGRVTAWSLRRSPLPRAAALGLLTPLLPCGLAWAALATAALTGSTTAGARHMLGFALGSLPALALAPLPWVWLRQHAHPTTRARLQRGALAAAALLLLWRGWSSLGGAPACCS